MDESRRGNQPFLNFPDSGAPSPQSVAGQTETGLTKTRVEKSTRSLKTSGFTDEANAQLVVDLLTLKKAQIERLLVQNELPGSGTKADFRDRIECALRDREISPEQIAAFLDEVTPWGKQHVYLYKGPSGSIEDWKRIDAFSQLLKKHRLGKCLNAIRPFGLPKAMKISSIFHDGFRIRVTAIKRREWSERNPEYDKDDVTSEGDAIDLRAFVRRVTRGLVAFEWDLIANTAFLQISQLSTSFRYEEVAKEFFDLISKWLDTSRFSIVDLRTPIQRLHELEERGSGETRSHGINYRSLQGRRLEGKSASSADPLLGEAVIDEALAALRKDGVAVLGNFYFLPGVISQPGLDPLGAEVHVIVVGRHNRINFPTASDEKSLRYVLSRIRSSGA